MTEETARQPVANPHCWSCRAEIGPTDRFCKACGTRVMAEASAPRATLNKKARRHAAIMFLLGLAIVLFALVHRNPADIILVVAFGLPLCGAGAITWRMA